MNWSPQQEAAIKAVKQWLDNPSRSQIIRLFGFAGTGKTTLALELAGLIKGSVLFATFTGKAALVLRSKGCEGASTIHSLIYKPEIDEATGEVSFVLDRESALHDAELLIIDEVSMVGEDLARDLLSFEKPILVLGDPAQLPPVSGQGFFIEAKPDAMLTEVHRQAAENPIIRMSMDIREGKPLLPGRYGESLIMRRSNAPAVREEIREHILGADQVICGMNKSRELYNRRIRTLKGLLDPDDPFMPSPGDRLICLKNDHEEGLLNGALWEAEEIEIGQRKYGDPFFDIRMRSIDEPDRDPQRFPCLPHQFSGREKDLSWKEQRGYQQFTFGWAITCHKAQGSQWDWPVIFDESGAFREHSRNWIYTAITRAAERVTLII